jgi:plastocyanin
MRTKLMGMFFAMAVVLMACAPQTAVPATSLPVVSSPEVVLPATSLPATSIPATSLQAVSGNETKINISGFAFDPATITIKVGQAVTWTNQDSVVHTVVASDNSWSSDSLETGASFSHTFDTAGTFTYICGVHPSMKGTVIVQP